MSARIHTFLLALLLAPALLAPSATAQVKGQPNGQDGHGGPMPPGLDREKVWPAPSDEDWKKPCLIPWERTWEDAVAVSRATGKPILICVNMDGEIASEYYAGILYRKPGTAALFERYVPVVASVYRHNPRDYDEQGRRIPCPRFGSITCGEHIAIEPELFERFFDGRRIAPRHIMVKLDGTEGYDVYYTWDVASVVDTIEKGVEGLPETIADVPQTIDGLVASRDARDRTAAEKAYLDGDSAQRRDLLQAAIRHTGSAPNGVLRLALYDLDLENNRLARIALSRSTSPRSIDLILDALRVPLPTDQRDALIAALDRLGSSSPRARTLANVQRGLGGSSAAVDVDGWSSALAGAEYPAPAGWDSLEARLETDSTEAGERPADPQKELELAESSLALAVDPKTATILSADPHTASAYASLMFEDARRAGLRAEELGASGWRIDSVVAIASWYLHDLPEAYRRAEKAVAVLPKGEDGWNATAALAIFAEARRKEIADAVRAKKEWPSSWVSDVDSAYEVLAKHPLGTDAQAAAHYDFLRSFGARGRADRVLDEGLARFPGSAGLHHRLRDRILEEKGAAGLEPAYGAMLAEPDAPAVLEWFAGYASIVAAEFDRRARQSEEAGAAYERAIAHFERFIASDPASRDSADHYVALARAGESRLALEAGDLGRSLDLLLASFQRRPQSAGTLDGLNLSPADTSRTLKARLAAAGRDQDIARLDAALAELDPELLKLPAYERLEPGEGERARRPEGEGRTSGR